ncbi:MAG TPA: hypothetical protein P5205_13675 [Candidatus Paceibacterota bacterium]|nr:hypothetical protein [Verrucomicrobiota bacterium]HSA11411.1 hypothetical protein [Candidatus Paceibacterota bacterium]
MLKALAPLLFLAFLATSCSTPQSTSVMRFNEQERADLIVRYYSDDTNYVLKPEAKDGPFLSVLKKDRVLDLAKQQPSRELAVIVLINRGSEGESELVQQKWSNLLMEVGYQRVVFLRAMKGMQINGLPVLASGG